MHVIRPKRTDSKFQATPYADTAKPAITTGSGLNQLASAGASIQSKPASQRSVPPSTRAFAKDMAAFYGETQVNEKTLAQARTIRNGDSTKPPSTRQFAQAYKAFYDVDSLNDGAMEQVRQIKNGQLRSSAPAGGEGTRITTGMRQDPNFRANMARFHGAETTQEDEIYKNYRAFYGGATPNVNQANHMGKGHQAQQKQLLRNKLADTAKRILNTKSFDDGYVQPKRTKAAEPRQSDVLKESGFSLNKVSEEPASYQVQEPKGAASFTYARNPKVDKVTKTDPPIKNLNKMRYNIITGSLQDWY